MRVILKPGAVMILVGVLVLLGVIAFFRSREQVAEPSSAVNVAPPTPKATAKGSAVEPVMWALSNDMKKIAMSEVFAPQEKPGNSIQATRYTIKKPGKNPWDISVGAISTEPMPKDSQMRFSVWARSTTKNKIELTFERSKEPYERSFSQIVTLTPEWKEYGASFKVANDFSEIKSASAKVHMSFAPGVVELASLKVIPEP